MWNKVTESVKEETMRISTQILNRTMRRAGLPMNNMSLLSGVNSGGSQESALLSALKKTGAWSQVQRKEYQKLEESSKNLQQAADTLQSEELYEEARQKEDTQSVCESANELVQHYNAMLKSLKSDTSPLNQYYRETLVAAAKEETEGLGSIGITQEKDGALRVDQEKLKAADLDTLEKVLGGTLTEKISFLSQRIGDNAKVNASSASSQYDAAGGNYFAKASKYDFWG